MLYILYVAIIIVGALCYFYRSPDIFVAANQCKLIKPCGGKLDHINHEHNYHHLYWFLNLFDIHTQYVPICGVVESIERVDGKNYPANDLDASHQNERVITKIRDRKGGVIVLEQVAGLITRRIDNYLQPGQRVLAGQKLGRIHLGSRVVMRVPDSYDLSKMGDRVGKCYPPGVVLVN